MLYNDDLNKKVHFSHVKFQRRPGLKCWPSILLSWCPSFLIRPLFCLRWELYFLSSSPHSVWKKARERHAYVLKRHVTEVIVTHIRQSLPHRQDLVMCHIQMQKGLENAGLSWVDMCQNNILLYLNRWVRYGNTGCYLKKKGEKEMRL